MTSKNIPTKSELEVLVIQGFSIRKMARHYGVCPRTIENWRNLRGVTARAGRSGPVQKINYENIDRHLAEGKLTELEISKLCQCSHMSVSTRFQKLFPDAERYNFGKSRQAQYERETPDPFIPLERRLEIALKKKAVALGQSYEWTRTVWLKGQAGRQLQEQMP
jgi:transposase-like protein